MFSIRVKLTLLAMLCTVSAHAGAAAAEPKKADVPERPRAAVMTGEQVVKILDETVDWYRTLGTQQQTATQPSDLLIVYANRQTADKVMALAFEIARANAELLSSEASAAQTAEEGAPSLQALEQLKKKLDDQRVSLQAELESVRHEIAAATGPHRAELQTKLAVLQSEYDLVRARINLRDTMVQFTSENDAKGFDANALKTHIDAIAASIPSASALTAPAGTAVATTDNEGPVRELLPAVSNPSSQLAIWSSAATVLRLSAKIRTIDAIDQRTESLQQVFSEIRTAPLDQLKKLAARGDALAAQSDTANSETLKGMRDQFDTLAWLFKQTSSILTPLSKEGVLLKQYRHNLANWRDATKKQYHDALKSLGMRIAIVAGLLALVFGAAELWRRAVFRYVTEARRQYRLLLVRKIILWCLVIAIVGATFATELGSLVTFAGLITAGLAVAMQSVLVSVVGYFFLIGKYGIRVGDRVQIGNVTGEVIELGLVRLHLMELSGQGPLGPTGRVVAFANSIIFQASGGLFKQIPGVNLAWHDITLKLPAGVNYAKVKDQLAEAVVDVIEDFREDIVRQTREIQKTALSSSTGDARPQVQLRFSADGVEASVRYPVQLQHAAEIDERVSQALLNVVSTLSTSTPQLT